MKKFNSKYQLSSFLLAVSFVGAFLVAGSAAAGSQSVQQRQCINAMGEQFQEVATAQRKHLDSCVREGIAGSVTSIEACVAADLGGHVKAAKMQTLQVEQNKCGGESPDFGYTSGANTNQKAMGAELDLARNLFGDDFDTAFVKESVNPAAASCQRKVLRSAGSCSAKFISEFNQCATAIIATGGDEVDFVSCKGAPTAGLSQACETEVDDTITAECVGQDTASLLPGCGTIDLATCILAKATAAPGLGINVSAGVCEAPQAPVGAPAPPAPEKVTHTTIPLPAAIEDGAYVYSPIWTIDGSRILFAFGFKGGERKLGLMAEDGTDFVQLPLTIPKGHSTKPFPFKDGRRIFSGGVVVECTPSVLDCQSAEVIPVQFPAAGDPRVIPGQVTTEIRLAPDDVHIAWTSLRIDAPGVLAIGELRREPTQYVLDNVELLSAPTFFEGPPSDLKRPSGPGGGEVKQFIDGGRSLVIGTGRSSRYTLDAAKINIATGEVTWLTDHPGWDETAIFSPDEKWFTLLTTRFEPADLTLFGQVPHPTFTAEMGFPLFGLAIGISSPQGGLDDDDRGPYLIDSFGDREGYFGQTLKSSDGYHFLPLARWHPDGTKIVWAEQKKESTVGRDTRIRMAHLVDRLPITKPVPVVTTPDAPWANSFEDLVHSGVANATGTLHGLVSGQTRITTSPDSLFLLGGSAAATFTNHSDDGRTWANGTEDMQWSLKSEQTFESSVRVHGCSQGLSEMTVVFAGSLEGRIAGRTVKPGSTGVTSLDGNILSIDDFR